ncbi:MAG: beta-ketoacyl synthase N-terminal-like domain-containing protein, partial [Desulfobacterales bacterium]
MNRRPAAIVGMGCFFPQSPGLKAYLRLLVNGRDAVGEVPPTHWSREDYFDPDPRARDRVYCARGGFLTPVDFDPTAFGIPPALLEATDTSQLLALLAARAALADMGLPYNPARTSVILGVTGTQELVIPLSSRLGFPRWRRALAAAGIPDQTAAEVIRRISDSYVEWQENSFPGLLGNVVAGRISNRLNLGGTNCVVDAACASSLAAVHMALLELDSGRCDLAITGGVDTLNDIFMHMCFAKTQVLSPTGDARPFSRQADGTVLGEGVGIVVLKRLEDAERDGNQIYAVLRGLGSSSDGRSQSIYAPRREGQVEALRAAYAEAGVEPATVGLIEAHGTGTRVGDRVEFEALCEVFKGAGAASGRCALGSVKSMIGHTKAAAGVAGLIKTALALHHRVLFPTLKAEDPDPALNVASSPFHLCGRARPWFSRTDAPRRAGVSAFGFGGSNFHAVLEEHGPSRREIAWDGSVQIFSLSAESRAEILNRLDALAADKSLSAPGEAWSRLAARTRLRFDPRAACRLLFPASDAQEARERLAAARERLAREPAPGDPADRGVYYGEGAAAGALAVVFPGQGSQYPDMGRELVLRFPEAFETIETAQRVLGLEPPLGDLLYPPHPPGRADEERLQANDLAQPAIGAASLALWKALRAFGLSPAAAAGHSFGELTALCAAGRLDEEVFFALARSRGRAMAQAPPGSMAAVFAPLAAVDRAVSEAGLPVVVANRNAPRQAVVSGPPEAVAQLAETFGRLGVRVMPLPVGGAFHSPLMAEASRTFAAALERAAFAPAAIPVFSGQTRAPFPPEAEAVRRLLAEQMLSPIDFVGLIEAMYAGGVRTFVEIGPRAVLSRLVAEILAGRPHEAIPLDSSSGRKPALLDLATALCRIGALGHPLNLALWDPEAPEVSSAGRMCIPICGANLGPSADRAGDPPLPPATPQRPTADADQNPQAHREPIPDSFRLRETPMAKPSSTSPATRPAEEFRSPLEEGLEAIRRIHEQTAQAHEKFLDLQRETTRALMELIRGSAAGLPAIASAGLPETSPGAPDIPARPPLVSAPRDPLAIPAAGENRPSPAPAPAPETRAAATQTAA